MELVVKKNDLLRELQLFQGIVERKNTIPILANVLMEGKDDEIRMLATDLEVGLRSRCDAAVEKARHADTAGKETLRDCEGAAGNGCADHRRQERRQGGGGSIRIENADAAEGKIFPRCRRRAGYQRDAAARGHQRDGRQNAVCDHRRRHAVFSERRAVHPAPGSMSLVATDGHRLALVNCRSAKATAKARTAKKIRAILPRKTLWELGKLLTEGDGDISYERGENHLFFDVGGRMLISRMIDGQFPAFERVIPKGNNKRIEFERERLTNAVKRVALLSNERSRAVKFQLDKGKVEVTSSSPEFGEAKETLPVDYTDASMQICFNAQYVMDFLGAVNTDNVALELKDEVSQAVMKPVGTEGYDYTYVIMPMRV